jgi:hypothetical protein
LLAARLAKFGFNAMHAQACDSFTGWPDTRSLIDYSTGNGDTLDKERLDRFDYLLAAMRKRGLYVVLPLLNARRFLPGDSGDPANPLPLPPITTGETWNSDDVERHQRNARQSLRLHSRSRRGVRLREAQPGPHLRPPVARRATVERLLECSIG